MPPKGVNTSTRKRSAPSAPSSKQTNISETTPETELSNQQRLEQLASLENRKGQLCQDLQKVEGQVTNGVEAPACSSLRRMVRPAGDLQIYELESRYLDSCNPQGNALKGMWLTGPLTKNFHNP